MGKAGSKQGWKGLDTDDPDRDRDEASPERPTKSLMIIDDPRSPTQEVERTPIQALDKDKKHEEVDDPRSPSSNVPRTPLEQKPPLHKLDLSSEDPREPTSGVDRTPLNKENKTFIQQDILGAIEEEQGNEAETREEHPVNGGDDVILKETNGGKRRNPRSLSLGQLSRSAPSYNQLESDETDDVDDGLVLMGKKRTSLPSISTGKGYNKLSVDEDVHELKLKLSEKNEKENDNENEKEKENEHENTLKEDAEREEKNPDTESTKLITVK